MAVCQGCGVTNDEKRRDPDTGVLVCRSCKKEVVEEVVSTGKEKKGKGTSKTYSQAPSKGKKSSSTPQPEVAPREPRIRAGVKTAENLESKGEGKVSLDKSKGKTGVATSMFCPSCDGEVFENEVECVECGYALQKTPRQGRGISLEKEESSSSMKKGSETGFRRGGRDSAVDSSREQAEKLAETGFQRRGRDSSREQAEKLAENGFEGRGASSQVNLSSVRGAINPYGFCWGSMLGGIFLPLVNGNLKGTIQLFIVGTLMGMVPLMGPFISFYYIATQVPAITAKECSYTQAEYNLIFSTLDKMGRASMMLSMVFFVISLLLLFLR